MLNKNIFSTRLKLLREKNKVTMLELANAIGLKSKSAISQFESQTVSPSADTLIDIADYFGVSIDYLTGRIDTPYCEEYLLKLEKELLKHMPYTGIPEDYKDATLRNQHYTIETRLKIIALMKIMVNDLKESIERHQNIMKKFEPGILNDTKSIINYGLEKVGLRTTIQDIDHDEQNRKIKLSQDLYKLLNDINKF